MKKIAVIFFALFALSVNAFATTVTVSSTTITQLPFNPSNIGNDRTITVSVTNASATVTSAALFPSSIVGIGGFQVSIGGTQYVVASVQSTSSLTLTTTYSASTGSASLILYKYVLMRAYATAGFQDNVTGQNIQPGTPGSGNFYKQFAVSIINSGSGNVAYLPEFTIPSTTDALINNQAKYVFGFYRTDGSLLSYYLCGALSQLAIQPGTPTTWQAICNYNAPPAPPPSNAEAYSKGQIDQRFPNCSSGQSYYFAANGNVLSCLTYGSGLTLTGGTLTAAASGSVTSVALSLPSIFSVSGSPVTTTGTLTGTLATQTANTVFAGPTSGGAAAPTFRALVQADIPATALSQVRQAINVKLDYGCVGDGVTSDQTCMANALTAAAAAGGKEVYVPAGTYLVTGLTVPGGVTLQGDGKEKTIIKSATNGVILNLVQGSGTWAFIGPKVRDLWVDGSDSGSSQIGIQATDASFVRDIVIENVTISDCGSHGLSVGKAFSSEFKNIYSTSNGGYPFLYDSANMPSNYFYGLYAGDIASAAPAGYRIKAGTFVCWSCNGVNVVPATAYWAVLGAAVGDIDGDLSASYASVTFRDCNIEGAPTAGVLVYPGSVPSFTGETSFVGLSASSGAWVAILYDTDAALFPENARRGYIDDTVVFSNSPASFYTNSQPIRSDGLPPLEVNGRGPRIAGGSFYATYYNTATSRAEQLNRADGYSPQIDITTSTSFTNPGGRAYSVTCGSNCTLTLPSPLWYSTGNEFVTVVNRSTTGVVVTIAANGGGSVNGSSYTLSVQGASAILFPDATALDWRVIGNRIGAGSANYYPVFDSTNTITQSGSLIQNSSGSLLFGATTLYGTDNTINIGSSGDNRPANVYVGTAVTAPKLFNVGGGACFTSGSATPEGATTCEPGSIYLRTNGTWYIKSSGSGNTGWTLVGTSGTIGGSGTTGALAKFTAGTTIGDSILTESSTTLTAAGRLTLNGLTINTDANNTVASLTSAATFTKNDTNNRTFDVVRIKPTFNFGGSNNNTVVNLLSIDSTNTAVTGTIFNLINAQYGGSTVWAVDSSGAITFANGVRQAFSPSTVVASLNFGQVASDPSSPVDGDCVYNTGSAKFRCYENASWKDMINTASGTVNSGTQYQLGYYATTAAAISGNSGITTSAQNILLVAPTARTSGAPAVPFSAFRDAADTGLSNQEQIGFQVGGNSSQTTVTRTLTGGGGAITTWRNEVHVAPTIAASAAQTITNAYATTFDSITAGSNVTITNNYAVRVKPTVTTHHGLFVDGQVSHTGDLVDVGMAGTAVVRLVASAGTVNSVFTNAALSSGATDGFVYLGRLDSATNPTGTPTTYTGGAPILIQNDTTQSRYTAQAYVNGGWRDLSQSLGHTTPSQITADQNNYNPGAVTMLQRWSTDASRQITGLTFTPTQMSGQMHIICNVGTQDIVLVHSSASSTAANRFATTTAANITIVAEQCAQAVYDGASSRWRAWLMN